MQKNKPSYLNMFLVCVQPISLLPSMDGRQHMDAQAPAHQMHRLSDPRSSGPCSISRLRACRWNTHVCVWTWFFQRGAGGSIRHTDVRAQTGRKRAFVGRIHPSVRSHETFTSREAVGVSIPNAGAEGRKTTCGAACPAGSWGGSNIPLHSRSDPFPRKAPRICRDRSHARRCLSSWSRTSRHC